ncbi:MAG: YifB family Mg chelatase-like AAA ATPase [Planctomycetes bacterium]|nr:YifB family Mg chelatase-like AAA ATPase [Planctomycetota bacterium]
MTHRPVRIGCAVILGVDAVPVTLEVTLGNSCTGVPRILGLADAGVREAYFRVMGGFAAQGLALPRDVPTINLTPATIRKTGNGFDLPMALGLAGAAGEFAPPARLAAAGEVSLSGEILPTPGIISVALAARDRGWTELLTAPDCARHAALVPGISVYAAANLREAILWRRGELQLQPQQPLPPDPAPMGLDLGDIRGHATPKLALQVAAAGRHNLLMVGPPGSGKSALARRLVGLLPPPDEQEALEILKIHTVDGRAPDGRFGQRPMRAPHHTSSSPSLLGGGRDPRPGEITLAQHGVLFLDELPEFRREAIEGLRQPLEEGRLTIGRVRGSVTMPADFLLICAMNPCPCGYASHPTRPCRCSPAVRDRYRARVSGPLLDRIDLQVEVPNLEPTELRQPRDPGWSTAASRARIAAAIERQRRRSGRVPNGRLENDALERAVGGDPDVHRTLDDVLRVYRMSGRARVRLLRIARTLADLDGRDDVCPDDVLAATRLRGYAG